MKPLPSHERVQQLLAYDPQTGIFTWRIARGPCAVGREAGCTTSGDGYRAILIDRTKIWAHRLAWFYVYGQWPTEEIDHRNGDRLDNRLINLRVVSHTGNAHNRRAAQCNNRSTGVLGVYPNHNGFKALIRVDKALLYLGTFATTTQAHAAYLAAKRKLHMTCTI